MASVYTDAWDLTRELSVRDTIRVYTRHGGAYTNTTRETSISKKEPASPWAMYLAWDNSYQYLVFDIDNHTDNPLQANSDLNKLQQVLDKHHIEYLVCSSSNNGGYHIWIALIDSISAQLARHLAFTASRIYPSLDPTCLLNPATGCVRPPLSPHWKKGKSCIIYGNLNTLLTPTVTEQQILTLLDTLTSVSASMPTETEQTIQTNSSNHSDSDGMPYIPGVPQPLSHTAMTALRAPVTQHTDTSVRLYQITLSAVRNHWTYNQYIDYIQSNTRAPGFTHAYTRRNAQSTRITRDTHGSNSMLQVVARMWRKAHTSIISSTTTYQGNDAAFIERSANTTRIIEEIIAWNMTRTLTGTGQATDQRVLNTISLYALQAHQLTIQADIRRVALACGISRQAASNSLRRLIAQNIISLTAPATGRQAHAYTIHPIKNKTNTSLTTSECINLDTSEYAPTPATLTTIRHSLLSMLTNWLKITSHDACTYHGIGIKNGNKLATQHLDNPVNPTYLDQLAHQLGCAGITATREATYTLERALWAWWTQELTYLTAPAATRTGRATVKQHDTISQLTQRRYPRPTAHTPNYQRAKQLLTRAAA